jgi:hypothetical protein
VEQVLIHWLQPVDPIYRREVQRGEEPRRLWHQWGGCIVLIALALIGAIFGLLSVAALLVAAVPLLGWAWRVRVALSATDAIAREVERQRWSDLRALPWPASRIVMSKYAGALMRARGLFPQFLLLRLVATVGMLAFVAMSFWYDWAMAPDRRPDVGWALLAVAASALYSLAEPLLDFATDGALGLVASAFARGQRQALTFGLGLSATALAGQFGLTVLLVGAMATVAPGADSPLELWESAPLAGWGLALWGPGGALLFNVGPAACVLLLILAAVLRYAWLRGLLALAVWRASR